MRASEPAGEILSGAKELEPSLCKQIQGILPVLCSSQGARSRQRSKRGENTGTTNQERTTTTNYSLPADFRCHDRMVIVLCICLDSWSLKYAWMTGPTPRA